MSNLIFKVSNEKFSSGKNEDGSYKGKNYKLDEIKDLCNVLGLNFVDWSFSSGSATLRDNIIDISADRQGRWIDLRLAGYWSDSIRIKELTQKKADNVVKKLESFISERCDRVTRMNKRHDISYDLSQLGINVKSDRYFSVDDLTFRLSKDGEIVNTEYLYNRHLTILDSQDYETVLKKIEQDILTKKVRIECAMELAQKHIDKIKEYYELV